MKIQIVLHDTEELASSIFEKTQKPNVTVHAQKCSVKEHSIPA
jgi:hypothetical protein